MRAPHRIRFVAAGAIGASVGIGGQAVFGFSNAAMYLITGAVSMFASFAIPCVLDRITA